MSWFSGIGDALSGIGSGLSNLFSGAKSGLSSGANILGSGIQSLGNFAQSGIGNLFNWGQQGLGGLANFGKQGLGGLSNLFGFGGNASKSQSPIGQYNPQSGYGAYNISNPMQALPQNFSSNPSGTLNPSQLNYQNLLNFGNKSNSSGSTTNIGSGSGNGGIGALFKGLAGIGASQLVGNPKVPQLPTGYNQLMSQIQSGGNPMTQAAGNYYQNILSGTDQDSYNAATYSIDQNYQEQLRQLNAMYKSLRPGTDPTSDSTYQRDLQNLNNNYQQQRAMAMAQVQQGAASGAMNAGNNQIQNQMAMLQPQLDNQNLQFQADYAKRNELRNMLMSLGGNYANYGALSSLFPNLGR